VLEIPRQTEQLGHAHILAKEDAIIYVHMDNIYKIIFLFEGWNFWISRACETTNRQVEVALLQYTWNISLNSYMWHDLGPCFLNSYNMCITVYKYTYIGVVM